MKAFKAYDIRGVFGTDITPELAYQVGRCLPTLLNAQTVLIGRDARVSSLTLRDALAHGLSEAGAKVNDLGLATTPMVYFFTAEEHYGASVMITASHNPKEYNGLKVSKADARPCGYDQGLKIIEEWIEDHKLPPKAKTPGTIQVIHRRPQYLTWLNQYQAQHGLLRYAVDCSDGSAGILAPSLFADATVLLNSVPDGTFPHHGPNPLDAKSREQLVKTVLEHHLDLGLIFDGDADRVAFIDELGRFVPPDAMIALFAQYLGHQGDVVIHDVRTSRGVIETLQENGFVPFMVRVGAAFAKTALREKYGICGGEVAGHYYFRNFHWCDSGELAACIALDLIAEAKKKGQTFSELLAPITSRYYASGEVNVLNVQDRVKAIQCIESAMIKQFGSPIHCIDFDGIRLDWEDAWFGVRASNTEPILRLAGEARDPKKLEQLINLAKCVATNNI